MSAGRRKYENQVAAGRITAQPPTSQSVEPTKAERNREVDLLTPQEVAAMLRVPVALLYKWRTQGIGPKGFKVGRYVRYWRSHVVRWIEEQESASG